MPTFDAAVDDQTTMLAPRDGVEGVRLAWRSTWLLVDGQTLTARFPHCSSTSSSPGSGLYCLPSRPTMSSQPDTLRDAARLRPFWLYAAATACACGGPERVGGLPAPEPAPAPAPSRAPSPAIVPSPPPPAPPTRRFVRAEVVDTPCAPIYGSPYFFDFSPDGRRIVELYENGDQCVWHFEEGRALHPRRIRSGLAWEDDDYAHFPVFVPFSPNGRLGVTFDEETAALVWRLERRAPPRRFNPRPGEDVQAALLTDTALVLKYHDDDILVYWLDRRGKLTFRPSLRAGGSMIASDDGSLLALANGGELGVWELSSGVVRLSPKNISIVKNAFGFTPGAKQVVAVGTDGVHHTWDLEGTNESGLGDRAVSLRRGGFTDAWVAPGAAFTVGVAAGAPAIYRVNLGTVQVDPLPITLTSDWMAASFSRDGTRMALHGGDHRSWVIDVPGARVEALLHDEMCHDEIWRFGPSGAVLTYGFAPCVSTP